MAHKTPRFDRIYMVGHAHLDPVWLWRWTEGYQEARATLAAAVKLLGENPDYVFTMEQMAVLEWVRESEPELFDTVRGLVADRRIAMVGGWWVEPDCNLPCLEAFVRHGLIGQRYLLEHFGGIACVALNSDPFGHAATLPQIFEGHRLEAYCFLRPSPHETEMPYSHFEWAGIGGASIATYRIPHQYCQGYEDITEHMHGCVEHIGQDVSGEAMIFYGVGNHGGGPTRRNLESLAELDGEGLFGELTMAGPHRYFVENPTGAHEALPVWNGELQRHAAGCYAAHSGIKRLNLRAEAALLEAERFATIAARLHGVDYPAAALDDAWKALLFNQFHDILPGSAIAEAYEDAEAQLGGVIATAQSVSNRSMQIIARDIGIAEDEETQPILLFNPNGFAVDATVEVELSFLPGEWVLSDENGKETPWQRIGAHATMREVDSFRNRLRRRIAFRAEVPALGHKLYRLRRVATATTPAGAGASVRDLTLQNEHLRITIDPKTGWLAELTTLADNRDFAPTPGSAHTVVSEDASDTWGHGVESYVLPGTGFEVESITVEDAGPVRASIRVNLRHGQSTLSELFILDAGSRHLEIRSELDWHEKLKLLKLRFPSSIRSDTALYQLQYSDIERPTDGKEYPGQRWVSVADDNSRLTVINDSKYAYDCVNGDIGITAARSPVFAWHDPQRLDPDAHYRYQDQGFQQFTCYVLPHGTDDIASANRLAEQLIHAPKAMFESFHDGKTAAERHLIEGLDQTVDVQLTAIKPHEDDPQATVFRLVNNGAEPATARFTAGLLGGREVVAELAPGQIKTIIVPAEGPTFETDLLEFEFDRDLPKLSEGV